MIESGVYTILNKINGKRYIGSSQEITKRRNLHFRSLRQGWHHSKKLQRAWDKYGEDAFEFIILEMVNNPAHLVLIEQVWMDWFDCVDKGYNILHRAGSCLGVKRSEETKAKIRSARAMQTFSEDTRQKMREFMTGNKWCLGYKHTEEAKKNMSEAQKKNWTPERRKQHSDKLKENARKKRELAEKVQE